MPIERSLVYHVIDTERDYQDSLSSEWVNQGHPDVPVELLLAEEYLNRAKKACATTYGDPLADLNELRSVAAICVRCMEHHGVVARKPKTSEE